MFVRHVCHVSGLFVFSHKTSDPIFLFLFWETAPFRGCLANAGLVISLLLLVVGLCSSCITMAVCGNSSILRHTEDQKAEMGAYRQNGLILRF